MIDELMEDRRTKTSAVTDVCLFTSFPPDRHREKSLAGAMPFLETRLENPQEANEYGKRGERKF